MAEHQSLLDWWQKTIIYQVYPRSFQDSNGDGVGDLRGIRSRLDHLQYIGVQTVWLSPIYRSPMVDFGYDVSDYRDVDPVFGTLSDFDDLIRDIHERGMYLVMDFIPNHTSDQHPWFRESSRYDAGAAGPRAGFYVWDDGKLLPDGGGSREAPNNWLSRFGHSAWTWHEGRQQYYFHQYTPQQPDLNYRNPEVRKAMLDVLQFWLDRGVDGFRIDAIRTLIEAEDLSQDEPRSFRPGVQSHEVGYLNHVHTLHQPELHEVVREWRQLLDAHEQQTGHHVLMVMEAYDESPDLHHAMRYYHSGGDFPINFNLLDIRRRSNGWDVKQMVDRFMSNMPESKWPNFALGSHDRRRVASRVGAKHVNALNVLLLTLPGTPTTYQGEEIGAPEIQLSFEDTQDPRGKSMGPELYRKYSRDPCRGPMQWSGEEKNAGFSTSDKTWLPVNPDYKSTNVQSQLEEHNEFSPLQVYRRLARLRQQPTFQNSHMIYHVVNDKIFSYLRGGKSALPVYLITMNIGHKTSCDDYSVRHDGLEYTTGRIVLCTTQRQDLKGSLKLNLDKITLQAGEALVLKLE